MEEQELDTSIPTDTQPVIQDIQSDLSSPPAHSETAYNGNILKPAQKINYELIEKIITTLRDTDFIIKKKIEQIESLDISVSVVTYKVYDATHDFKVKINDIKEQRNKLLTSVDNKSELSLILHDLDERISDLNRELQDKINNYNQQKITFQEKIEDIISQLDEHISNMNTMVKELKNTFYFDQSDPPRPQVSSLNEKYIPNIKMYENNLFYYLQMQLTGWRIERSEEKLAGMLEEQGLKFTPSNKLLTRSGSRITFEEAQQRGYLKDIDASLHKILDFFQKDQHHVESPPQPPVLPDYDILSGTGSMGSKMCSEDVKYLKQHVGKPLTLALAEILAKQPRDPIHYLGHYLFKYRYNQELEIVQKKELDELSKERAIMAEKIWKKFIEDEARAAVIEMVLRSEEIAYQNELARIAEEQMLAVEEEEGDEEALEEEARDKFE